MAGFDEYGSGHRIDEHLGRNLIGDFVRNWQEGLVSDDHVLCPRAHCRKERDTLAFAKPVRRLGVCSDLENRPDALKSRNSQSSFRNRHDRPPLRKGGKNMDITGMDWSIRGKSLESVA